MDHFGPIKKIQLTDLTGEAYHASGRVGIVDDNVYLDAVIAVPNNYCFYNRCYMPGSK